MSAPEALQVLVIDDDKSLAETIAESLERRGHACTVATSGKAGAAKLEQAEFDVVLTDLRMADLDGLAVVKKCRELRPDAEVFVITGFAEVKTAIEAMKLGASHYLQKPIDLAELRAVVDKSAERVRTIRDLRRQIDEKFGFQGVVGNSPKMLRVLQLLKAYAPTTASVLILGENGTGKELAAKALHTNSPRKGKPFAALNCAALNENLLDDELFGHEDGSYTGAKGSRKGRFEYANGGTMFLDEVGDMPLSLQAKLLRVLENGEVVRIGANDHVKVDVRIIAATNKDLRAAVLAGQFREDLLFRLDVIPIAMPPLRERASDVPALVSHFVQVQRARTGRATMDWSEEAMREFVAYRWPGNVRELGNIVERLSILHGGARIHGSQVRAVLLPANANGGQTPVREGVARVTPPGVAALAHLPLSDALDEFERALITRAVASAGGNIAEAARRLQTDRPNLYRRMRRLGIPGGGE